MAKRHAQRCIVALSILTTSFALEACVTSREALLGLDTRVLPFSTGTTFEVYWRQEARDSWKQSNDAILVADDDLGVRDENLLDPKLGSFSFHPNGDRKFLVQARFEDHYAYAALEIRNGEGLLDIMDCDKIDQDRFQNAGGRVGVVGWVKECKLDTASNIKPLELLRSIVATTSGPINRYVPIRRPSSVKGPTKLNRPSVPMPDSVLVPPQPQVPPQSQVLTRLPVVMLPPTEFDHPIDPSVKLVITKWDTNELMKWACKSDVLACTIRNAKECLILLGPGTHDHARVLRHEIGHFNGWGDDHAGARP